jgi:hypothetical protein
MQRVLRDTRWINVLESCDQELRQRLIFSKQTPEPNGRESLQVTMMGPLFFENSSWLLSVVMVECPRGCPRGLLELCDLTKTLWFRKSGEVRRLKRNATRSLVFLFISVDGDERRNEINK